MMSPDRVPSVWLYLPLLRTSRPTTSLDTMKKGLRFGGALVPGAGAGVDVVAGALAAVFVLDESAAGFALVVVAAAADGIVTCERQEATRWGVALGAASLSQFVRT